MSQVKLFNTLSRKVEEFEPLSPPEVGMYTCGPTVYDHMHIGNLRTFVLSDLLYRVLRANGFDITSVENITDIDDKIIK
ncbi:cysteine--tRNA ligase, partial [Candidatus Daviesbacteria bacterium]|nr:cysteine--tRNA ligase [Candidatus Daviesbacteria bacterium]